MLFDPRALLLENTERLTPLDSRLKRILKSSIKTEHSVQQFNTTECFLSVTLTNLPYTNIFIETSPSTVNRSLIPPFSEAFSKSLERMITPQCLSSDYYWTSDLHTYSKCTIIHYQDPLPKNKQLIRGHFTPVSRECLLLFPIFIHHRQIWGEI